jgi:hypothetical protein
MLPPVHGWVDGRRQGGGGPSSGAVALPPSSTASAFAAPPRSVISSLAAAGTGGGGDGDGQQPPSARPSLEGTGAGGVPAMVGGAAEAARRGLASAGTSATVREEARALSSAWMARVAELLASWYRELVPWQVGREGRGSRKREAGGDPG